MLKRWFIRTVLSRSWLTFLVMGVAFFIFGAGTYNLLMLFSANAEFVGKYGWEALTDGAAQQFAELVITGYISMAAYVIFKTCEHRLAHVLSTDDDPIPAPPKQSADDAAAKPTDKVPEA